MHFFQNIILFELLVDFVLVANNDLQMVFKTGIFITKFVRVCVCVPEKGESFVPSKWGAHSTLNNE